MNALVGAVAGQTARIREKQLLEELGEKVYEALVTTGDFPSEEAVSDIVAEIGEIRSEE